MYIPEFKGPLEGYVVNYINKQHWRLARTHDREDMKREAHYVFLRCAAKYPIIDTPQHFMALFKTAWSNHVTDLSHKATAARAIVSENQFDDDDEEAWAHDHAGELDNDGQLAVMLRQAPREVLMVLNLFLNAPQELLDLATQAWVTSGRRRVDGNVMVGRLLGMDPEQDPLGQVHEYFRSH